MTETLTYFKAVQLLDDAVASKPEGYVFEGTCRYFDEASGEPLCIVGHVFAALGYTADKFRGHNSSRVIHWSIAESIPMSTAAKELLNRAQVYQDSREPWAVAVALAKEEARP